MVPFCANAALSDINRIYRQIPVLHGFDVCIGGGCAEVINVSMTDEEWQTVVSVFVNAGVIADAEHERSLIAAV
ncbi:MAG TPA: hypothetical protein VK999_04310, partial [Methylotenera sp.]|nr:hypothetical protein [Methylotenera sp.]